MKDEQLSRQRKIAKLAIMYSPNKPLPVVTPLEKFVTAVKKLSWEELQRQRERGLCFYYNDKFTPNHKYRTL